MKNTHLLNIDDLTWNEYLAWWESLDIDFLLENTVTWPDKWRYNQLRFKSDFGSNLCTLYWFLPRLSTLIGRVLTEDEEKELCQRRYQIRFTPSVWGYYTDWADCVRHWHNELFPEDPLFSVVIQNSDPIRQKFFQKGITLTSTFRANKSYYIDVKDGFLDKMEYWKLTFWHCVGYHELIKEDNYLNEYSFRKSDDYYTHRKNGIEGNTSIALFKNSQLTSDGKLLLKAMQTGLTNGDRMNDLCTRFEWSRWCMKLRLGVPENKIWSKTSPNLPISLYELSIMMRWSDHAYLGTDRSKQLTRREALLYCMSQV